MLQQSTFHAAAVFHQTLAPVLTFLISYNQPFPGPTLTPIVLSPCIDHLPLAYSINPAGNQLAYKTCVCSLADVGPIRLHIRSVVHWLTVMYIYVEQVVIVGKQASSFKKSKQCWRRSLLVAVKAAARDR